MILEKTQKRIHASFLMCAKYCDYVCVGMVNTACNTRYMVATDGFDLDLVARSEVMARCLSEEHIFAAKIRRGDEIKRFSRDTFVIEIRALRRGDFISFVVWRGDKPIIVKNVMRIMRRDLDRNETFLRAASQVFRPPYNNIL